MTWTQLLANNEVKQHTTSKKELDSIRAAILRDLGDASLKGLSADRRFATAYNAALQATKMAIACAGYRVTSGAGHHRISFEAAKLALGKAAHQYCDYLTGAGANATPLTTMTRKSPPTPKLTRLSPRPKNSSTWSSVGSSRTVLL